MGRMEAVVEMALAELVAGLGYELAVLGPSRLCRYTAALGTAVVGIDSALGIAVVGIVVVLAVVLGIAVVLAVVLGIAVVLAVVLGIAVVLAAVLALELELGPVADN
jgi:hypothetical protein